MISATHPSGGDYVLGLDLGTDSVGWAVVDLDQNGNPCRVRRLGIRRFDAGVTGAIETGQDAPRTTERRQARQQRRQLWRRAWRAAKVYRILQEAGLLPSGGHAPDQRHQTIAALDRQLAAIHVPNRDRAAGHLLPYLLRAKAVGQRLAPHELGRALYHLAQRRGFQSNLRARKDDEDEGIVKKGISQLDAALNGRTLGEYFATLDPEETRIRSRYTSRRMYEAEFNRIWDQQAEYHPDLLTPALKAQLRQAIFHQRPLKSQRGLVGRCELEPGHRRAPLACLLAQRFRLLQKVNDLEIIRADGEIRRLRDDERRKLVAALDEQGDMTFAQIRKLLGLQKPRGGFRGDTFNFEEGGEKNKEKLVGNRTAGRLAQAIGAAWQDLSSADRQRLVDEILSFEKEEALVARLQRAWKLDARAAQAVADARLEQGYASHSRTALRKLLPLMEQGVQYIPAKEQVYGKRAAAPALNLLPPVFRTGPRKSAADAALPAFAQLRNPTVARALTELRKVVNHLIRSYGKPRTVRVELARDLKRARKSRREITKRNRENEKARDEARKRILQQMGERYCTDRNVLKLRLTDECNWICPYTGKQMSMVAVVGDHPQFDIEHILPFSRALDNSFANKTLCCVEENRQKHNRTPFEAYANTNRWPEILQRVRRFRGPSAKEKLRRFQLEDVPQDFANRQLNDTRYFSRLAGDYLGTLYGGQIDAAGTRRVQVTTGGATAYLRERFNLDSILGRQKDEKDRSDHRHHAIDALIVALTDASIVKKLAQAAERADNLGGRRLFAAVDPPWPTLLNETRAAADNIRVSSRVSRKLNGQLHDANPLSKPHPVVESGKTKTYHHIRKPLANMSKDEVAAIVDDRVRALVQAKLEQLGQSDPKRAFQDPANHPYFTTADGRTVFIHRARIRKADKTIAIGQGSATRYVAPGANHHMEIVAVLDAAGRPKRWEGVLVSRFEAVARRRNGQPVIQRDHGPGRKFLFSLTGGEHVVMRKEGTAEELCRVTGISDGKIEFIRHADARPITVRKKIPGARVFCTPNTLRKFGARKVVVDPLGELLPACD